jgi:hypothetical protein
MFWLQMEFFVNNKMQFNSFGLLSSQKFKCLLTNDNTPSQTFEVTNRKNQTMKIRLHYDSEIALYPHQVNLMIKWTSFFFMSVLRSNIDMNKLRHIYIVPLFNDHHNVCNALFQNFFLSFRILCFVLYLFRWIAFSTEKWTLLCRK